MSRLFAAFLACSALSAAPCPTSAQVGLDAFLTDSLGLTPEGRAVLDRGDPFALVVADPDSRHLGVVGAMRLSSSARLPEPGEGWRVFAGPAVRDARPLEVLDPALFDGAELPSGDLRDLLVCEVGACLVKATGSLVEEVLRTGESGPGTEAVRSAFRHMLLASAREYRADGTLPTFVDKPRSAEGGAAWRALVGAAPEWRRYAPSALSAGFPAKGSEARRDYLLLARERFGLKPLVRLDHVTELGGGAVQLRRQVYVSHYFEAAAELMAVERSPTGTWLVYVRRHRFDDDVGGLERRLIEAQVLGYVEAILQAQATLLDAPPGA